MQAVIYATDFSLSAQNPGLYAALLAKHFAARLIVAHAFTLSQAALEVEMQDALISRQRKDLEILLSRKGSGLAQPGVKAVPLLLEGDPVEVLAAAAEKYSPALLVLGTHGGGRFRRALIGSTAEQILRSTRGPVMTVGPAVPAATQKDLRLRRILYATDLTPSAAKAAPFALCFARQFQAQLDILHVVRQDGKKLEQATEKFSSVLHQVLPEQAQELAYAHKFVEVGHAHQRILAHIREHAVDLLVLGIQKRSHLGLASRKATAFQLILDAPCPVLTITG